MLGSFGRGVEGKVVRSLQACGAPQLCKAACSCVTVIGCLAEPFFNLFAVTNACTSTDRRHHSVPPLRAPSSFSSNRTIWGAVQWQRRRSVFTVVSDLSLVAGDSSCCHAPEPCFINSWSLRDTTETLARPTIPPGPGQLKSRKVHGAISAQNTMFFGRVVLVWPTRMWSSARQGEQ